MNYFIAVISAHRAHSYLGLILFLISNITKHSVLFRYDTEYFNHTRSVKCKHLELPMPLLLRPACCALPTPLDAQNYVPCEKRQVEYILDGHGSVTEQ